MLRTAFHPRSQPPQHAGHHVDGMYAPPPGRPYAEASPGPAYPHGPNPDAGYPGEEGYPPDEGYLGGQPLPADTYYGAEPPYGDEPPYAEPPYGDEPTDGLGAEEPDEPTPLLGRLGPLGITVILAALVFTFGAGAAAFAFLNIQSPPSASQKQPQPLTPVEAPREPAAPSDPDASASTDPSESEPPSAGTNARVTGDARQEAAVAALVNQVHENACRQAVRLDARLRESARAHSADMAEQGFFNQTGSDGSSPQQRMRQAGYDAPASENVARGGSSARDVVQAWLNSGNNRANLQDCSVRNIGVGVVASNGSDVFWTLDLGR